MPASTMYDSSVSWDPMYNRIVLYKLMPAVVVLSMASLTNIVCACIIKILKLIILIVKVYKVVQSINIARLLSITCRINKFCCLDYSLPLLHTRPINMYS